ncbi:hypothetical protein B0H14DRAFT_3423745 [Mycena olivaceomarginata]|nr:hypothetical protein B0H14DRAFT_3423745 [Mycena olivaceomarginata]
MWVVRLLGLLAVALPLAAQSFKSIKSIGSNSAPSAQITVITSVSTSIGLGASRVATTALVTNLITSTIQPAAPTSPSGDPSNSAGSSSAQSSTSTANLPTGTVAVVTDQAPSPGATGGAYGPDDNYINAARALQRNSLLLCGGLAAVVGFLAI